MSETIPEFEEMTRIATGISNGVMGIDFVYCLEEDKIYQYTNGYWKEVFSKEVMLMICKSNQYGYVVKHAISKRQQIIENIKIFTQKRLELFNAKGYLNFDIGEFDPDNMKMYDHCKENYSTMRFPYPYDYKSNCPEWIRTIEEIMQGDKDKIDILQEFFGYCLTRDTTHRKALLLLGESNCGKSTILNVLRAMVGNNNCSSVPLHSISDQQHTPRLINKLVNIDSDVSTMSKDFEADFKIITSGEPISCNQKFIETFEFIPYCKIVMAANSFPKITDHSSAVYNRLILIPCDRIFTEAEMNRNLFKQLEKELSGIFNWAVNGLKRLKERGMFTRADFMKEAVKELEDLNNPTNIFFEDFIEVDIGENVYIEKGELYKYYKDWCMKNGHGFITISRFSESVYKKFSKVTPKTTSLPSTGKRIWRNLKYVESKGASQNTTEKILWSD